MIHAMLCIPMSCSLFLPILCIFVMFLHWFFLASWNLGLFYLVFNFCLCYGFLIFFCCIGSSGFCVTPSFCCLHWVLSFYLCYGFLVFVCCIGSWVWCVTLGFIACIGSLVSTCVNYGFLLLALGFWFLIFIKCIGFETIFSLIHVCFFSLSCSYIVNC